MSQTVLDRLRSNVRPDEGMIPTFVHGDPDVHRLELERVFQHAWLFVAHESEVSERRGLRQP